MAGLIPFNKKNEGVPNAGYEDFYFMLDDFFNEGLRSNRTLSRDTFKIDVKETEHDYTVEAELPGVSKEEIDLSVENQILSISVIREEDLSHDKKDYIHKERHIKSMGRRVRLGKAKKDKIEAMLNDGVLTIVIPKDKGVSDEYKITIR